MTIKEAIKKGTINLKIKGIEEPNLKARLLMQYVLNKSRQYILVYDNKTLTQAQEFQYFRNIEKLIKKFPLQHITHQQEFMKMTFYVDENVLIPRPDTETLVEEVIQIAKKINAEFSGKGGGKPPMVQGFINGKLDDVRKFCESVSEK